MRRSATRNTVASTFGILAAVGATAVGVLTGASAALGDVGATSSGDGFTLTMSTPGPVLSGVAASYTITVSNTSAAAIPSVTAEFQLAPGMSLKAVPANCVKNRFGGNAGPAACSFGTLAPGATAAATVSIVASTPGTDTIGAAVTGLIPIDGSGFQVVDTSVDLAVPVTPGPADIQVTGSSNNGSPPVGSPFSYTFQVKDNGSQGASGVTFDDALPATVNLGSVSTTLGACSADAASSSVHCDLGDLGVGQQATVVITAVATATGPVTDTASVAMMGADTQPANNTVGVTVQPR
jgi:large repetitive protein